MATGLDWFEHVVRSSPTQTIEEPEIETTPASLLHPFDLRNVYSGFPQKVRDLFNDGHCAEATFAAFKYVDKIVQKHSGKRESGQKLMMAVFSKDNPVIKLNSLANQSEEDEQEGYRFMFAGAVMGIRNPGGHEVEMSDDPDVCLDHLSFASLLIRRLERSGLK